MKFTQKNIIQTLLDSFFLAIIIGVGWFLIGYYLEGDYLMTGYQDWIYHTFRAQSLERYEGMPSWDHIWSNGINHWRSYQYIQHWIVLSFSKVFDISFPQAMLLVMVSIFIGLRFLMYIVMRLLHVRPIVAFFSTIASYAFAQQWIAISDFSIFIALIIVPFYFFLWTHVYKKYNVVTREEMKNRFRAEAITALLFGGLWLFHPVVANALGGLFFISIGFRALKIKVTYFLKILFFYILGATPFFLPYFSVDYGFTNPMFTSPQFLVDTIVNGGYFGLSLFFLFFFGGAWIMALFFSKEVPSWSKAILMYVTLYIAIIFLAQNEYIPNFIIQFQISRVIPTLAILITFAFAGALSGILQRKQKVSVALITFLLILSSVAISESIAIATIYTSQPIYEQNDPISLYFNERDLPRGSIYVKDVSSASYFGKQGLRFVTSLNEHFLPHPLSLRFSHFMRSEIAYTGIPLKQVSLIRDYATVLGIEYLVIPETSPLVKRLTEEVNEEGFHYFTVEEYISSTSGQFAILRNTDPVYYAYLFDETKYDLSWKDSIIKPTMQVNSYAQWDESISLIADAIRSGEFLPVPLEFIDTNVLKIDLRDRENKDENKKTLFLAQSHDMRWKSLEVPNIEPSNIRFMLLNVEDVLGKEVVLKNTWPWWHWPLQFFGINLLFSTILILFIRPRLFFEEKKESV